MNNARRKKLKSIVSTIESAKVELENVLDDENECLENIPESLQCTDRYSSMEEAIACLEDANSLLDDAINNINDAIG